MILSLLLTTPLLGIFLISILHNYNSLLNLKHIKLVALCVSIINLFIFLIVFMLFNSSTEVIEVSKLLLNHYEVSRLDELAGLNGSYKLEYLKQNDFNGSVTAQGLSEYNDNQKVIRLFRVNAFNVPAINQITPSDIAYIRIYGRYAMLLHVIRKIARDYIVKPLEHSGIFNDPF